jgi:nucleoredoxin
MDLFSGATLVTPSGAPFSVSELTGKHVLIYFSAHWCPPCRGFTPVLSDWVAKNRGKGKFEVVFVSSDKEQSAFDEYHRSMTFPALAYENRALKDQLSKKFGVQGIPTLVVLSPEGEVITKDGRSGVMSDPQCEKFPWAPKKLSELLAAPLLPAGRGIDGADVVALYFSASWCGPCKQTTPLLINTYNAAKAKGHKFEVIFVSADRDEKSFASYFAQMPWTAISFDDEDTRDQLNQRFEVEGIPHVVLIDRASGRVINKDAVGALRGDQEAANFPWKPKPVEALSGDNISDINETATVWLVNGAKDELEPTANAIHAAADAQGKDAPVKFFFTNDGTDREVAKALFSFLGVPVNTDKEQVIVVDIPSGCKYVYPAGAKQDIASIAKRLAAGEALENPKGVKEPVA